MRKLLLLLAALPFSANAAPFLVSDPVAAAQGAFTIDTCAYTRGSTTTFSAVEVVTGGVRCKIDLASDPKTGTVTVAFRDSVLNNTGTAVSYSFGGIPQTQNLRVIP